MVSKFDQQLGEKLRKILQPEKTHTAPTQETAAVFFQATITAVNATTPPTVNVQQGSLAAIENCRYDEEIAVTTGKVVYGFHSGSDYYITGAFA